MPHPPNIWLKAMSRWLLAAVSVAMIFLGFEERERRNEKLVPAVLAGIACGTVSLVVGGFAQRSLRAAKRDEN